MKIGSPDQQSISLDYRAPIWLVAQSIIKAISYNVVQYDVIRVIYLLSCINIKSDALSVYLSFMLQRLNLIQ